MKWTADQWPIGAALIQFPGTTPSGASMQEAGPEAWRTVFDEVRACGFDHVDITDSWLRPGDLAREQQEDLARALKQSSLGVTAISVVRRSVLDPDLGQVHLDYALRTVEAAAVIGIGVVCLGLHRPLTPAQQRAQWFWTEPGAGDDLDDPELFELAVRRFRQVGDLAADLGVELSLELYEDTLLGTADAAVRLVQAVGLPNVGLNPDIGNLVRLHRPVESWMQMLEKTLPHTNYWHVKNYFRDHDPATGAYFTVPAPAESGVINYRLALHLALEAGFEGPICVEHYGGDGLGVSASNRDYLRAILRIRLGEQR